MPERKALHEELAYVPPVLARHGVLHDRVVCRVKCLVAVLVPGRAIVHTQHLAPEGA